MTLSIARTSISAAVLGALNLSAIDAVPMYFMNVPLSTAFMAFVGSMLTLTWSEESKKQPRKTMYMRMVFVTLLATTLVAVLPPMMGWEWYSNKLEGSLAFLLASILPYVIPIFKELLPELLRKWLKLEPRTPRE